MLSFEGADEAHLVLLGNPGKRFPPSEARCWTNPYLPSQRLLASSTSGTTICRHSCSSASLDRPTESPTYLLSSLGLFTRVLGMALLAAKAEQALGYGIKEHANWSPYEDNGGTCVAIAGSDYCLIAADTRMSMGFSILTRNHSKLFTISEKCVLASSGFQADVRALQKNLEARHKFYQHQHGKVVPCPAMAQLLSNTLYYKRFFPYYAFNILAGLDGEGKGCVYTYDAVGSYERTGYAAQGSGSTLIMPVLDNQLKSASPLLYPPRDTATPLTQEQAVDIIKDTFATAAERQIYTGDGLEIAIINASGIHRDYVKLRED